MDTATIGAELSKAARQIQSGGVDAPRLTAEALVAHVSGLTRAQVLARPERVLNPLECDRLHRLVARAADGEPLAYLLGTREFFGLDFEVTPAVLVPRPETESLVELALDVLGGVVSADLHVIDVGTGSGIIGVTLAQRRPNVRVTALDVSPAALAVARRNAARHGVPERVRFLEQDLLDPVPQPADMICANLPYIPAADVDVLPVSRHEPRLALDGGADGLDVIRRLVVQSIDVLKPGGVLLLEIEARQGPAVAALCAAAFPGSTVRVVRDLAGLDRVVQVTTARAS